MDLMHVLLNRARSLGHVASSLRTWEFVGSDSSGCIKVEEAVSKLRHGCRVNLLIRLFVLALIFSDREPLPRFGF